jgi:hypothetical protein
VSVDIDRWPVDYVWTQLYRYPHPWHKLLLYPKQVKFVLGTASFLLSYHPSLFAFDSLYINSYNKSNLYQISWGNKKLRLQKLGLLASKGSNTGLKQSEVNQIAFRPLIFSPYLLHPSLFLTLSLPISLSLSPSLYLLLSLAHSLPLLLSLSLILSPPYLYSISFSLSLAPLLLSLLSRYFSHLFHLLLLFLSFSLPHYTLSLSLSPPWGQRE